MTSIPCLLHVDDDVVDRRLVARSLTRLGAEIDLREACDGLEALEMLRATGDEALPATCVILLDLNMPRMGGLEFLDEIRKDPELKRVPVFVFSTSKVARDINGSYDRGISGYLCKDDVTDPQKNLFDMLLRYANSIRFPTEH